MHRSWRCSRPARHGSTATAAARTCSSTRPAPASSRSSRTGPSRSWTTPSRRARSTTRGRGSSSRRHARSSSGSSVASRTPIAGSSSSGSSTRRTNWRCPVVAELQAFIPGIYPRSEALVQATRDLDRGRTTQEAVDEQVERDLAELVSGQQDAGLDLLADGMLRWQDHFRPVLEAADGLETGALTRFLDTNTFFRAPKASAATPNLGSPLDERYVA